MSELHFFAFTIISTIQFERLKLEWPLLSVLIKMSPRSIQSKIFWQASATAARPASARRFFQLPTPLSGCQTHVLSGDDEPIKRGSDGESDRHGVGRKWWGLGGGVVKRGLGGKSGRHLIITGRGEWGLAGGWVMRGIGGWGQAGEVDSGRHCIGVGWRVKMKVLLLAVYGCQQLSSLLKWTRTTKKIRLFLVQNWKFEIWKKETKNERGFQFIDRFRPVFIQNSNFEWKPTILKVFKFIFLNCNQLDFCETKNQTKPILLIFIITERILSMFESMLSADVQRHKSEHIQHTFNP
jgi:hypothetical protein